MLHHLLTVLSPTIMSNTSHSIPEPFIPEHQLLADAAPEIELSANFRSHVLAECAASHALAQKILAAKLLAGTLTFLFAASMFYVWWKTDPPVNPQVQQPDPHTQPDSPRNPLSSGNFSATEGLLTHDPMRSESLSPQPAAEDPQKPEAAKPKANDAALPLR
ncbi:MAG: hypothetical protein ABJZ55_05405 [Fuerstiella sp.]